MGRWKKLFRSSSNESLPTADVTQFEPLARPRLSQMAYDYVRSGGADEISMRENRAGFERLETLAQRAGGCFTDRYARKSFWRRV